MPPSFARLSRSSGLPSCQRSPDERLGTLEDQALGSKSWAPENQRALGNHVAGATASCKGPSSPSSPLRSQDLAGPGASLCFYSQTFKCTIHTYRFLTATSKPVLSEEDAFSPGVICVHATWHFLFFFLKRVQIFFFPFPNTPFSLKPSAAEGKPTVFPPPDLLPPWEFAPAYQE